MYREELPNDAYTFEVAALSDVGRVRKTNQDAFGYSVEGGFFTVCDGMGGAAGGEIASQLAVETFLEHLHASSPLLASAGAQPAAAPASTDKRVSQAVAAANRILHARARRETRLHGMGTTLVALVLDTEAQDRALVAHVGDSRCYLYRDAALTRCTEDHSLVEEQVRLGQLTRAEAEASPMRNVITRAVGVRKTVAIETQEMPVARGDLFLLCSDGLTRELSEERIAALLGGGGSLEQTARSLMEEALAAGGNDNVTCLLLRLG